MVPQQRMPTLSVGGLCGIAKAEYRLLACHILPGTEAQRIGRIGPRAAWVRPSFLLARGYRVSLHQAGESAARERVECLTSAC